MNKNAKRDSWKHSKIGKNKPLDLHANYINSEFSLISMGSIPSEMEDKWFIFFEGSWLYIHRSWSGRCIYQVRFDENNGIAEALISTEDPEYNSMSEESNILLLRYLIDGLAGRDTASIWNMFLKSRSARAEIKN